MAKSKFYAVRKGVEPGIYDNWAAASANVTGFKGAEHASFATREEAEAYMAGDGKSKADIEMAAQGAGIVAPATSGSMKKYVPDGDYAFVDGSFNGSTNVFGYGGFLYHNGRAYPLMGSDYNPFLSDMRNVAGEIWGAMKAVQKAEELGIKELKMLYDYRGIEEWATGRWRTNKPGTQMYADFMQSPERTVHVTFEHVDAHTGIEGNEMADVMAKNAVGIPLTKKESALYNAAIEMGRRDGVPGVTDGASSDDFQFNELG